MIKKEHSDLLAQLVAKLEDMELRSVLAHFEAMDELTWELCQAMEGAYAPDALPDVAAAFNELVTCGGGLCDGIFARFWRVSDDAEEVEMTEVDTWAEANQAEIATEGCNWSSPRCTRFETFASTLADRIERCISGWEYATVDTEHESEFQWFTYRKEQA